MFKKSYKPRSRKVDPETGEEIVPEITDVEKARTRTMNRAVTLLAAKPRSIAELRTRLLEKQWTNVEIVESVLKKLEEYNYLNDEQFAKGLAASKLREKAIGKMRLRQTLNQKQLDKETIEKALETVFEETPESDLIDRAIAKRLRLKGKPETREDTKKFFDYLLRQGFAFDLVRDKMRVVAKDEIDENE